MTLRSLNYTGRKKLARTDTKIHIYEDGQGSFIFHAELHLETYKLPPDAYVFVEAYRQTEWKRFSFGTVGEIRPHEDRRLTQFGSPEGILFRVRVTSLSDPKSQNLAEADRIQPREPKVREADQTPILPVKIDTNLRHQIFNVSFEGDRPYLLINDSVGNWRELCIRPVFFSLVYPAVFRQILTRILWIEKHYDSEDMTDWRSQWLKFSTLLGAGEPPTEEEEYRFDDWIDETVAAFAMKERTKNRFMKYWNMEQDQ